MRERISSEVSNGAANPNLDRDELGSPYAVAITLAEKLLPSYLPEDDARELIKHLFNPNCEPDLSTAARALKPILPKDIDCFPLAKQTISRNFIITGLRPVYHLATSLIEEQSISTTHQEGLLDIQIRCATYLREQDIYQDNIHTVIENEIHNNRDNLDALSTLAIREKAQIDVQCLMHIQPEIYEMVTSNDSLTSEDINYRKTLNSQPDTAHSLHAPELPNVDKLLSRYGDYFNFVEATASTKRGGYASTFGFLHLVDRDKDGNFFVVEYPHTMFDPEILNIKHPVINKLFQFEKNFQHTHDMLHNILPVYADHFIIHHPSAPITLGGYLPEYVDFGQAMRKDKSSYELALAILHKNIMLERFETNPMLLEEHVEVVRDILKDLIDLQQRNICPNEMLDHISFIVMSNAGNIFAFDSNEYQDLLSYYEQIALPSTTIHPRNIVKLFLQQEIITEKNPTPDNNPNDTKDQQIYRACNQIDDESAIVYLQDIDIDYSRAEQGSEWIVAALRSIGIEPVGMDKSITVSGRNRLRWHSITASSRRLKGLNEKIHGCDTIRFWNKDTEDFIDITPIQLIEKYYNHFEDNIEEYARRKRFRQLSDMTLERFKELAFGDANYLRPIVTGQDKGLYVIDKCIHSLIHDIYNPLSATEKDALIELAYSVTERDVSSSILSCLELYDHLVEEAECHTRATGKTFQESRQEILEQLMSLG